MRRALVTGGAGFVGSHLCDRLLDQGWEVWALDDLSTGSIDNLGHREAHPRFHFVKDSVLSGGIVNELVYKCDVVYHLAAAVGVRLIVEHPVRTLVTNVEGTQIVLERCAEFGKRVLVASSSEVYGDHREERPLTESARRIYGPTTERRWAYAGSKALDEFLALAYHHERALDCVIVRLFNTVGPRQTGHYGMVVPRFVERALRNEPLEIFGDGTQTRCFCHVDDVVRALTGLMEGADSGEVYNVGSASAVRIVDLAAQVLAVTGSSSELVHVPYEEVYQTGIEDMRHRIPDTGKVRAMIGWEPTFDLDAILADVVEHVSARSGPVPTPG